MKLRKPCSHDLYDEHPWDDWGEVAVFTCPGGVFLPDDTLVIEKVDGQWPEWAQVALLDRLEKGTGDKWQSFLGVQLLDALAVRE